MTSINPYSRDKGYQATVFLDNKILLPTELNELQTRLRDYLADSQIFLHGPVGAKENNHWKVMANGATNQVEVWPGDIYLEGYTIRLVDTAVIGINPGGANPAGIWAVLTPETLDSFDDPSIVYPGLDETSQRAAYDIAFFVGYALAPPSIVTGQLAVRLATVNPATVATQAGITDNRTSVSRNFVARGLAAIRKPGSENDTLEVAAGTVFVNGAFLQKATFDYSPPVGPGTLFLYLNSAGVLQTASSYPLTQQVIRLGRVEFDAVGDILSFRDDRNSQPYFALLKEIEDARFFPPLNTTYNTLAERLDVQSEYAVPNFSGSAVLNSTTGRVVSTAGLPFYDPGTVFAAMVSVRKLGTVLPAQVGQVLIEYDYASERFIVYNTGSDNYSTFDWVVSKEL